MFDCVSVPAGVQFQVDNSLPIGAMKMSGVNLRIQDSTFRNLIEFAQGTFIFQDSKVEFCTANPQSEGCDICLKLHRQLEVSGEYGTVLHCTPIEPG